MVDAPEEMLDFLQLLLDWIEQHSKRFAAEQRPPLGERADADTPDHYAGLPTSSVEIETTRALR